MNTVLEAFDYFVDDCLLSKDPVLTSELDLLASGALKDIEGNYEGLFNS